MMLYPRIPHDKKKNIKLTLTDIGIIQRLAKLLSKKMLAEMFNVNHQTIRYHIDSEYRLKQMKRTATHNSKKWATNPTYREKQTRASNMFNKRKYNSRPEFKKYRHELYKKSIKIRSGRNNSKSRIRNSRINQGE